ncbi:hypothetical protein C8Q77DRAFT_133072 [Trametes polyzona]|nr:hypothetical protein C8Q77DRAFT_133072 [Trametes polyzona]
MMSDQGYPFRAKTTNTDPNASHCLDLDGLASNQSRLATKNGLLRAPSIPVEVAPKAIPIDILPNELLIEILNYAKVDVEHPAKPSNPPIRTQSPSRIGSPLWSTLILVCRRWCALILLNSRLCRAFDIYGVPYRLLYALARSSKHRTYDIAFHHRTAVRHVVPVLAPITAQLRKLLLPRLNCAHLRVVLAMLRRSWPVLEELTVLRDVLSPGACCNNPGLEFPEERFPALSVLRLSGVGVSWSVALVSRLRRLELSDCSHSGPKLPYDGFLDILDACSGLEELRLHYFLSTACSDYTPARSRVVSLPMMQDFGFRDELPLVLQLLSLVRFPPEARIHLGSELHVDDEEELIDPDLNKFDLRQPLPEEWWELPAIRLSRSLKVDVQEGVMRLIGMPEEPKGALVLDFNVEMVDWTDWDALLPCAIHSAVNIFGGPFVHNLEISGPMGCMSQNFTTHFIDFFPEVQTLRIQGSSEEAEEGLQLRYLFTGLTDIVSVEEDEYHVFWAVQRNLQTLTLDRLVWGDDSMEIIRACLHQRTENGSPLQNLNLALYFPSVDDFEAFKAPLYEELCSLVPGTVTIERVPMNV